MNFRHLEEAISNLCLKATLSAWCQVGCKVLYLHMQVSTIIRKMKLNYVPIKRKWKSIR